MNAKVRIFFEFVLSYVGFFLTICYEPIHHTCVAMGQGVAHTFIGGKIRWSCILFFFGPRYILVCHCCHTGV